jgi:hypothetical protein
MKMKKTIILFVMILIVMNVTSAYTISGSSVYINDSNVFIEASPHTMTDSGYVYITLNSKVFSGNIDFAIGVNDTNAKMTSFEILRNASVINQTIPIYVHNETNGSYSIIGYNYTYMTAETWVTYNLTEINYAYDNKNNWYTGRNVPVIAGKIYQARFSLDVKKCSEINCYTYGKYDIAIKPSAETIAQSITNNHFYFIDPYYNTSGGNSMYYDGNYTVVKFTSNGTFAVNGTINATVLIVAGGGGGDCIYGGGGAGGLIYNTSYVLSSNISVVVGSGGTGGTATGGQRGSNSSFGTLIANGGGAGFYGDTDSRINGGSGGGAGGAGSMYIGGNATPIGQGNNGGSVNGNYVGGGGGGAGSVGADGVSSTHAAGNGGAGINYSINGSNVCYAGGGGGGHYQSGTAGTATCGGGAGGTAGSSNVAGFPGTNGLGGGGGDCHYQSGFTNGGNGGSGVVIVRYLTYVYVPSTANESAARTAIETGINSALTSKTIYYDQRIYTYTGTHNLGRFDLFVVSGNKRWGFNYITGNDTYTNIPSVGTTINIWENASLTEDQITSQVETLINATKN